MTAASPARASAPRRCRESRRGRCARRHAHPRQSLRAGRADRLRNARPTTSIAVIGCRRRPRSRPARPARAGTRPADPASSAPRPPASNAPQTPDSTSPLPAVARYGVAAVLTRTSPSGSAINVVGALEQDRHAERLAPPPAPQSRRCASTSRRGRRPISRANSPACGVSSVGARAPSRAVAVRREPGDRVGVDQHRDVARRAPPRRPRRRSSSVPRPGPDDPRLDPTGIDHRRRRRPARPR